MKKLSLKELLTENDFLQKEDLKHIFGGYGGYDSGSGSGQGCSIEATAANYRENERYGAVSVEESRKIGNGIMIHVWK